MPLSEQEQRLLDEMERSLYHNEADDVTTVGAPRGRASFTAILLGSIAGVLGLGLLLTGVIAQQPIIGVLGFALMFAGAVFAITPPLRFRVLASGRSAAPRGERASFMDSLNDRWDRRTDERGR
ncbi:DUF3040 domain-containing protein [uncultured Schumannella sp.]|jgi:predicted lipid-binding transport protein (Tim44 family)|uniref:DUF3040 domain-containing protein n=1 Tax=uncultured Schumannella sp. TaxID=1195956 RepID=UPI0025E73C81|nr:DUF3040 domain-containing protein [uncultured Schumannella sp.]